MTKCIAKVKDAVTKKVRRCRGYAAQGSRFCGFHMGVTPSGSPKGLKKSRERSRSPARRSARLPARRRTRAPSDKPSVRCYANIPARRARLDFDVDDRDSDRDYLEKVVRRGEIMPQRERGYRRRDDDDDDRRGGRSDFSARGLIERFSPKSSFKGMGSGLFEMTRKFVKLIKSVAPNIKLYDVTNEGGKLKVSFAYDRSDNFAADFIFRKIASKLDIGGFDVRFKEGVGDRYNKIVQFAVDGEKLSGIVGKLAGVVGNSMEIDRDPEQRRPTIGVKY